MVTLRGASREKDGRIHTDSTAKRVTVLLYLNPDSESWAKQEGCLRLLRRPDPTASPWRLIAAKGQLIEQPPPPFELRIGDAVVAFRVPVMDARSRAQRSRSEREVTPVTVVSGRLPTAGAVRPPVSKRSADLRASCPSQR